MASWKKWHLRKVLKDEQQSKMEREVKALQSLGGRALLHESISRSGGQRLHGVAWRNKVVERKKGAHQASLAYYAYRSPLVRQEHQALLEVLLATIVFRPPPHRAQCPLPSTCLAETVKGCDFHPPSAAAGCPSGHIHSAGDSVAVHCGVPITLAARMVL